MPFQLQVIFTHKIKVLINLHKEALNQISRLLKVIIKIQISNEKIIT